MQKKIITFILVVFAFAKINAQDVNFTQFYADKIYLNPALAGTSTCKRVFTSYRNQWPSLQNAYVTYTASYDQPLEVLHGGFGVRVMYDQQGAGAFNNLRVDGMYSFHLQITKKIGAMLGVQASVVNYNQSAVGLVFPSQISGNTTAVPEGLDPNFQIIDFSAGFAGYANDLWGVNLYGGMAVHHLTQPKLMGSGDAEARLLMKLTMHGGMKFVVLRNKRFSHEELSISPNVVAQIQGRDYKVNYGIYGQYGHIVAGVWARWVHYDVHSAISVLLGFDMDYWRLGYSYDANVSELGLPSGGAHEITLNYFFGCTKKRKYRGVGTITCPAF